MLKTLLTTAGMLAASLLLSSIGAQPALAMAPSVLAAAASFCSNGDREAAVLSPAPVEIPRIAQMRGSTGTARVRVDLSAAGAVEYTTIAQSSGDRSLDTEALRVAKATTYLPEIRNCEPVAGAYLFEVNFE
jgi:periplasmic protein TonB